MRRVYGCLVGFAVALAVTTASVAERPSQTGTRPGHPTATTASTGDDPAAATGRVEPLTLTDLDGRSVTLSGVSFTTGTRRLTWLADPRASTADARLGPVAVAFREPNSTTYAKGVLTLVPVRHIESIRYDYEKDTVTLVVKGAREPLLGSLQYAAVNVLSVTGKQDGKSVTYTAGVRGPSAVKLITFPSPLPVPAVPRDAAAKGWSVRLVQSKKAAATTEPPPLVVRNLKTLLALPGGAERLVDGTPVRNGPALAFDDNLKRFELLAHDPDRNAAAVEITTAAGGVQTAVIPLVTEGEKPAAVVGLLGEVEVGYKLIPLHTVRRIEPYERKLD